MARRWWTRLGVVVVALVAGAASAQERVLEDFDLERLAFDPAGGASLFVGTGETLERGSLRLMPLVQYQTGDVVLRAEGGEGPVRLTHRATLGLVAAWGVTGWLELGAQAQLVLRQQTYDFARVGLADPLPTGLGSPLLTLRVSPLKVEHGAPVDVALGTDVALPFAPPTLLAGEPRFAWTPRLSVGRQWGWLHAGLEVMARLREEVPLEWVRGNPDDRVESEWGLGLALASTGEHLRGGLDLLFATPIRESNGVTAEALASLRYRFDPGLELFMAAGGGVGPLPGTPVARVLAGFSATGRRGEEAHCVQGEPHAPSACPDLDLDGDGVVNRADACPTEPEDRDGYQDNDGCPEPDNDGDGVLDARDACPGQPGPAKNGGCPEPPADRDGDGVMDRVDACPNEPGPVETRGCVVQDADKDGVADAEDACPQQAGPAASKGCPQPTRVELGRGKLELKERVQFAQNSTRLLPESLPLLDEIAALLNTHPEVKRVRIEGHTDDIGEPRENRALSARRAEVVMDYLVQHGVDAGRLEAQGFGDTRPLAPNKSREARARNRRVEFVIVEPGQGEEKP